MDEGIFDPTGPGRAAAEPVLLGEQDPMAGRSIRGQLLDDGGVVDRLSKTIGLDDEMFDPTAAAGDNANAGPGLLEDGGMADNLMHVLHIDELANDTTELDAAVRPPSTNEPAQ